MEPLTMALIMGGSQAIKGIGQGISTYQQAQGLMSDEEKDLLRQLKREQDMGILGFSSGEMSEMERQYRNPQQAVALAQADQLKASMGAQGLGPADTFRQAMIMEEQQRIQDAQVADKLAAANLMERQRQEQQLLGLANKQAQQEAMEKAAITQALTMGIGGAVESGAQAKLLADQMAMPAMSQQEIMQQQELMKQLGAIESYLGGL